MGTVRKSLLIVPVQAQPCLMHQGCGLESVARSLAGHLASRQLAQLMVDLSEEFRRGRGVPPLHRCKDSSDIHTRCLTKGVGAGKLITRRSLRIARQETDSQVPEKLLQLLLSLALSKYRGGFECPEMRRHHWNRYIVKRAPAPI